MRSILIILFFLLATVTAKSQKWQPGYFYDLRGNKEGGLIRLNPSGKAPLKDEAFVEFKEEDKAPAIKISASEVRSLVVARDSFVIAANGGWSNYELNFVRVALNAPVRLFQAQGYGEGGGSGFGIEPGVGVGVGGGTGGFGTGVGAGISIPIGGGGRKGPSGSIYFYGTNTANMKPISNQEFVDVMSDVMGDEPEVVEQIKLGKYNLGSMEKLIAYFNKVAASHPAVSQ